MELNSQDQGITGTQRKVKEREEEHPRKSARLVKYSNLPSFRPNSKLSGRTNAKPLAVRKT